MTYQWEGALHCAAGSTCIELVLRRETRPRKKRIPSGATVGKISNIRYKYNAV